ncbi:hypothetical protein [Streptomyces sp. NBC_01794]|uniref:hypothetical protein n=1 Tax=unclassified Streptomyces TaxID=2593676 RepID=UPI003872F701
MLQQSLRNLNTAYRNFFAWTKGTRKGPKIAEIRFKSRKDKRHCSTRSPQSPHYFADTEDPGGLVQSSGWTWAQGTIGRTEDAAQDWWRTGHGSPRTTDLPPAKVTRHDNL